MPIIYQSRGLWVLSCWSVCEKEKCPHNPSKDDNCLSLVLQCHHHLVKMKITRLTSGTKTVDHFKSVGGLDLAYELDFGHPCPTGKGLLLFAGGASAVFFCLTDQQGTFPLLLQFLFVSSRWRPQYKKMEDCSSGGLHVDASEPGPGTPIGCESCANMNCDPTIHESINPAWTAAGAAYC